MSLARALVHDPQNIILDEPSNGLDVMATRSLRDLILKLKDAGRCVLFSSHVMQEVAALCDDIVIIANGKVAIVGVAAWSGDAGSGVGLVNMASVPVLATSVSEALAGGASIDDAAEQANAEADPPADINASVGYRQHLAKVLVKRALTEAAG